jgi:hypothetical protein
MPLFKRKDDHDEKLAELEAKVKAIRHNSGTEADGSARTLQSFLMEDDRWLSGSAQPGSPSSRPTPVAEPTATGDDSTPSPSEDEAMLVAELERYLSRIDEDTKPDADSSDRPSNSNDKRGDLSALS